MNMKEFGNKAKDWAGNHPKTVRFGKALIAGAIKAAVGDPEVPAPVTVKENAVLDAKQVEAISDMSSWQLSRIFKGKNATFASDPDTLKAIGKLSSWQIDAVLGNRDD